jgi:hypothetical protein
MMKNNTNLSLPESFDCTWLQRPQVADERDRPPRKGQRRVRRGGAAADDGAGAAYRLQVTITLERRKLRQFLNQAADLLPVFTASELKLVTSSWDAFGDSAELFTLWDLDRDADTLLRAMLYLHDVAEYFDLDALVKTETKALVVPLFEQQYLPPADRRDECVYLRTRSKLNVARLAEFQMRLEESIVPFREEMDWFLGDAYLTIIGDANCVTQLWAVPKQWSTRIDSQLAKAPWDEIIDPSPTYTIMQPAPFDRLRIA